MEHKKFTTRLETYGMMGGAPILPVPPVVAEYFLAARQTRLRCTLNGGHQFHRGLLSRGAEGHFLLINKKMAEAFGIVEGDEVDLELAADDSKYGFPVPEEWEEILLFDEAAARAFERLTPGRQRSVLHLVGSAKREATRIERALRIAENLKRGVTDTRDFLSRRED